MAAALWAWVLPSHLGDAALKPQGWVSLPAPNSHGDRERGALAFGEAPWHWAGLVHPPVRLTRKPACVCVSAAAVAWTFSRIRPWLDLSPVLYEASLILC